MSGSDLSKSLTLKGSCTGSGDQQDFSKQTILRNDGTTTNLMSVSTNAKAVTIEGFTFINDTENTGIGINASTGSNGSLTLKNCGFRISNTGLNIAANSGKVLIYNTLFADGGAQGLLQSANVTDNAYNELLTIGVEQGLPGMVAFAAVVVMALLRLRRSCRPLMYGLLALVVFSMFSYPLHCQPYRILFVLMCAWGAAAPAPSNSPVRGRTPSGITASPHGGDGRGAFCAFVFVLFLASLVVRADMERRVAASEDYRLMAGVDASYMIDDYYELLPLMGDNERFLFDFGKALAGLGRHNDSNAMLRWGAQLSADPMFTVLMGNNYRAMGLPAEAERCYRRAFSIMPNRIYPLYRLMKLYEEQGRRADCLRMARRVAAFDVKVESEATREMKREAENIVTAVKRQRNFSLGGIP